MGDTYSIEGEGDHQFIFCFRCLMSSWNKSDIKKRYCAHCHVFHEDPPAHTDLVAPVYWIEFTVNGQPVTIKPPDLIQFVLEIKIMAQRPNIHIIAFGYNNERNSDRSA